jgi:deazaflavin-dependent oxidoreductase (nitroreductase family)
MPLPRWVARFNLRVTNRILGPIAEHMPGMGIVIHQGRKTNRQYRTPVMVFRAPNPAPGVSRDVPISSSGTATGHFIIALTYGPNSQWVQNVLAHGGCDFESQGRTFHLTDPHLIHDERRTQMPAIVRLALTILNVSDFLELAISG